MTTREAAVYLGISVYYLRNMRHLLHLHDGPEYTQHVGKHGKFYTYNKEALDAWKAKHKWRKKAA